MARAQHHLLDVYGAWLHLATDATSYRAVRRRVEGIDEETPTSLGEVDYQQERLASGRFVPHYAIWINVAAAHDDRDLIDTLAHEAMHAALMLCDNQGVKMGGTNEAAAYITGWITGWLWDGVNRARARGNEKTAS